MMSADVCGYESCNRMLDGRIVKYGQCRRFRTGVRALLRITSSRRSRVKIYFYTGMDMKAETKLGF